MPRSPSHTTPPATSELANPQNLKWERKGGELGGSVNNYSLKRVDQAAFIPIKYINVHRINLIDLRNITQCSGKLYINYNKFKTSKVSIYLKITQSIRFQMFK
jgi:hypothetical protein